ncbi:MAG TPA: histidine phosphatase family protein [Nocardioidaceae bacterium]|nr:histidine phosphatase family protein [Nocardioidaceae bacterium]
MRGRRLVLWRHGQTAWNLQRRAQGQTDVDLDAVGLRQARDAAARLASLSPSMIVSSDLARARRTAQELATVSGVEVHTDVRLREVHLGEREGRTIDEVEQLWPEIWHAWTHGEVPPPAPGGESEEEVAERAAAAMRDVVEALEPGETGVVVAHGGSLRSGMWRFLGLPGELSRSLGGMSNCAWNVLTQTRAGHWQLVEYNAGTLPEPVLTDDLAADDEVGSTVS